MDKVKAVLRWVLAGFFLLAGLGYFVPSGVVSPLTGMLYILAAVLTAPIPAVADALASANIQGAVRVGAVLIALVAGTAFIPGDKTGTPDRAISETEAATPEALPEPETATPDEADEPETATPEEADEPEAATPEEADEPEPETPSETAPEPESASIPGVPTVAEMEAAARAEEERLAAETAQESAAEMAEESALETETEETETQFSLESCVALIKLSLAGNYEHYEVVEDGNIITIYVWADGVTVGAFAAKEGNEAALSSWNTMMNNMKELTLSYQKILDDNGHSDVYVALAVKNDLNLENIIASILSGVVIYDIVNNIALES